VNYYEHHLGDFARDAGFLSMLREGAYRRLIDIYYGSELPIPLAPNEFYELARCKSKPERDAVEYVLNKFFERRADGWHQKRCDEEIERYRLTEPDRELRKRNQNARILRHREERSRLFEELAMAGQHPAWNLPIAAIRALHERFCNAPVTRPVTAPRTLQAVTGNGTNNGHATASILQSPVSSPQTHSKPSPTPPLQGGASSGRPPRAELRAEKDQALAAWNELCASNGTRPPRTARLQAAIDAAGGWQRIHLREQGPDSNIVRKAFCDEYRRHVQPGRERSEEASS
jgi:uncharacterized protein YdaU (DUF1376 family)